MAKGYVAAGGGGGSGSDDCTATKNDVLKGKTAITSDSDDEVIEGTLIDQGVGQFAGGFSKGEDYIALTKIPEGVYRKSNTAAWAPEIRRYFTDFYKDIGLTADKLWPGVTILTVKSNKQSMAGQTITPSKSQQTVSCNGKAMTGNIVVNAIPSNYLDITGGQSVFLNGTFGPIVNKGAYKNRAKFTATFGNGSSQPPTKMTWYGIDRDWGVYQDESGKFIYPAANDIEDGAIKLSGASNVACDGVLFMGSIDFTKFKKVTVHIKKHVASSWNAYLAVFAIDPAKMETQHSDLLAWGFRDQTSDGAQAVMDVTNVNRHAYLYVGVRYSGSGSGGCTIDSIRLD